MQSCRRVALARRCRHGVEFRCAASGGRNTIATDATWTIADKAAADAAVAVLDRFMAALNAGDEPAWLATLHFPHYRLAGGRMRVWEQPGAYLGNFRAHVGADWHHSAWDFRNIIAAGPAKVHLDVQFTRYRADNSPIGSFRSLYIVTRTAERWAVAARSSFAD
jgi:hypothetical protein